MVRSSGGFGLEGRGLVFPHAAFHSLPSMVRAFLCPVGSLPIDEWFVISPQFAHSTERNDKHVTKQFCARPPDGWYPSLTRSAYVNTYAQYFSDVTTTRVVTLTTVTTYRQNAQGEFASIAAGQQERHRKRKTLNKIPSRPLFDRYSPACYWNSQRLIWFFWGTKEQITEATCSRCSSTTNNHVNRNACSKLHRHVRKAAVTFLNEIVPYYMYFYFSNMNKAKQM